MAPVLRVVDGDEEAGTMDGRELLAELAPVIERHLHRLPPGDPWRPTFERLRQAAAWERPTRRPGGA